MEEQLMQMMGVLIDEVRCLKDELHSLRSGKVLHTKKKLEKDAVTISEAATEANYSVSGIRKAISDGRLTAYKNKGGKTMVLLETLKNL